MSQTAFFSPADVGELPDEKDHYVVFTNRSPRSYICSQEPHEVHRTKGEEIVEVIRREHRRSAVKNHQGDPSARQNFYSLLIHKILEVYAEVAPSASQEQVASLNETPKPRDLAVHAQYLSQTLFGCELLVA
jgi:hypothetical protein